MRRKLAIAAAAALLALVGLGWLALSGSSTPAVAEDAPAQAAGSRFRSAIAAAPLAEGDSPPAPSEDFAAYLAMAEAGFVALRCWAGPEYDTEHITSDYSARIADGWYLAIERELEGRQFVVREFDRVDSPADAPEWERKDYEQLFEVSWSAGTKGGAVECKVHPLRRFDLRVAVVDDDGKPVSGAQVSTCGANGETDAGGHALLEDALAGPSCLAAAGFRDDERVCDGQLPVPEPGSETVVALELTVDCVDADDLDAAFALLDADGPVTLSTAEALALLRSELAGLRPLTARPLGEDGDRVLRAFIARQEESLAQMEEIEVLQARQARTQQQRDELMERMKAASTPEDAQVLARELMELLGAVPAHSAD